MRISLENVIKIVTLIKNVRELTSLHFRFNKQVPEALFSRKINSANHPKLSLTVT